MVCSLFKESKFSGKSLGYLFIQWFVASLCCCSAEYLAQPLLRWSLQLEGSGRLSFRGLRKGNSVVALKDGRLVATADDGSLHIVQTAPQVKSVAVYEPLALDDKYTECRSGVTLVYPTTSTSDSSSRNIEGSSAYAIYAVVDTTVASDLQVDESGFVQSSSTNQGGTTSRVLAVDVDTGSLLWTVLVPGRIQGDVVVGWSAIYVSHNIDNVGFVSVIMSDENVRSAEIVATLNSGGASNGPFGPPALQWNSGLEDVIIVAESWGQGFSESQGGLFMLSRTENDDDNDGGTESYQLQRISSWPNSAIAAPLVNGESVYLGASGGNIAGWTGNQKNNLSGIASGKVSEIEPRWVYQMNQNSRNQSQPVMSSPVVDSFGETLCTAGVDSDFYCLFTENGGAAWSEVTESQIMVRPQIWEDSSGSVVYTIESMNGKIRQFDLYTGETYWEFSCANIGVSTDFCQAAVEAEFAMDPSGNIIYYGDIFGRITAVEIANFETESPTISPTTSVTLNPTRGPTAITLTTSPPSAGPQTEETSIPVYFEQSPDSDGEDGSKSKGEGNNSVTVNSQTQSQQEIQNDSSSLGIIIGATLGGLCCLIVPFALCWLMRGGKRKGRDDEVLVEIIDDFGKYVDSDGNDREDVEFSGDSSTSDGIEIAYIGPTTSDVTPRRKKKKKNRSPHVPTPQTVITLESIEELPEEQTMTQNEDMACLAMNLSRRFDTEVSDAISASSTTQSSEDENTSSPQLSPGEVGVAHGTEHLELAVGDDTRMRLRPLSLADRVSSDGEDDVPVIGDDPPLPAPSNATLATSGNKWSWGALLNFGSPQSVGEKDPKTSETQRNTIPLRSESSREKNVEDSHRAETPPVSNHGKSRVTSHDQWTNEEGEMASLRYCSRIDERAMTPDPTVENSRKRSTALKSATDANQRMDDLSKLQKTSDKNVEEEKKENDDCPGNTLSSEAYVTEARKALSPESRVSEQNPGGALSPMELSLHTDGLNSPLSSLKSEQSAWEALSPNDLSYQTDGTNSPISSCKSEPSAERGLSPNEPSHKPDGRNSPLSSRASEKSGPLSPNELSYQTDGLTSPHSVARSPSNFSTDESLFTSATGATGDKPDDRLNLSPLSTNLLDKDILQRVRSDIPHDEATVSNLQRDLIQRKNNKFRYLDEDEDMAPDDEVIMAPGFQYMANSKADKFGRSARSKKDSSTFTHSHPDLGAEPPLAAIYNQHARVGEQKKEKKKHSFKRRSKRHQQKGLSAVDSEPEKEDTDDTWSHFLQELADAEKEFFSPASARSSLLKLTESQDSEDSEVARINKSLLD